MSDYRRFIAYLYEYPNNRKGGCCGFVRVESQNGFCRMDFRSNRRLFRRRPRSRSTDLSAGQGRMYGIPARKSPCGALFYERKTLHALRCHWADGCHARRAWRSDPALPPDRRHRHPVGRSSDSAGVFAPTLPQEPKTSENNGTRPTEEKLPKHPNLWIPPYLRSPCHHQTLQSTVR